MPDTFFRNEKIGRFHNILQPNLYVRVFPNGDVLYSIRVSLTCACSMHLALFPLDKQTCNLDVASCEYQYIRVTGFFQKSKMLSSPHSFTFLGSQGFQNLSKSFFCYACRAILIYEAKLNSYISKLIPVSCLSTENWPAKQICPKPFHIQSLYFINQNGSEGIAKHLFFGQIWPFLKPLYWMPRNGNQPNIFEFLKNHVTLHVQYIQ